MCGHIAIHKEPHDSVGSLTHTVSNLCLDHWVPSYALALVTIHHSWSCAKNTGPLPTLAHRMWILSEKLFPGNTCYKTLKLRDTLYYLCGSGEEYIARTTFSIVNELYDVISVYKKLWGKSI